MFIEWIFFLRLVLILQLMLRMKRISLSNVSKFGIFLRSLYFQSTYLKVSKTNRIYGVSWGVSGSDRYQYICLNSIEFGSGIGSNLVISWAISLSVTVHVRKTCDNPSRLAVLLSIIFQKVHLGSTVSSKALILLFSGSWLFLKRNKKFRKSFGK